MILSSRFLTFPIIIVVLISSDEGSQIHYLNRGRLDDTVIVEPGKIDHQPHCPEPYHGIPYVYFEESGKCHLVGLKGPCPENMRLFPQRNSHFGFCDCNCDAYLENKYHSPRSFCTGVTDSGEKRSLAYAKQWSSCQPLLEQSYCPPGSWLAFGNDPKKGPICEKAVCEVLLYDLNFYNHNTRKCEKLGKPCQTNSFTQRGQTDGLYEMLDTDWMPQCIPLDENLQRNKNKKL